MATARTPETEFPLHWLVWHNNVEELDKELTSGKHDMEKVDPRGRTPLHLAVTLGHMESCRVLLRHGANANAENGKYWTVVQEAVSSGDPELLQLCLQYRDYQRYASRTEGVPALLQRLVDTPDFYVEMKWEFTSWVPLVSRVCPSDVYRVWKRGSSVRIDTTLLGFDSMTWQRGKRSYVFKGEGDVATVMEIDHDNHQVYTETMRIMPQPTDASLLAPSEEAVAARLTSPIVTTFIDTEKISFERNKSGIWGWRSDKVEEVNTYECKVFGASNVELVTKTRTEHLTEQDKEKTKKTAKNPLESFLGIAEQHEKVQGAEANGEVCVMANNPCSIKPEDYFDVDVDLGNKDIGRPVDQTTKTQKFRATLWLSENYPLSLQEQVIPIIDLMAVSNAHFRKLKDFITLQLPSGFPVKIEIPLFHVLNARITFGNIFGVDSPAPGVSYIREEPEETMTCVIEEPCFEPPSSYSVLGGEGHVGRLRDEDDELLQFAIQQSLVDAGTENEQVTFWEALNRAKPPGGVDIHAEEERQLQRALEESMRLAGSDLPETENLGENGDNGSSQDYDAEEEQVRIAMEMSKKQQEEDEKRRKQEEEELELILKLSMTDK